MSVSEWLTLGMQVAANIVLMAAAVSRVGARLAVIETKLIYVERELRMHAKTNF